jgi:hypothetical protein
MPSLSVHTYRKQSFYQNNHTSVHRYSSSVCQVNGLCAQGEIPLESANGPQNLVRKVEEEGLGAKSGRPDKNNLICRGKRPDGMGSS